MAADWLCRIQEPDGNIPAIIEPLTGRAVKRIDLSRLPLTAWGLAEFGKALEDKQYIDAGERVFQFLRPHFQKYSALSPAPQHSAWFYVFFGELSYTLAFYQEALESAERMIRQIDDLHNDPNLFSYLASFLARIYQKEENHKFLRAAEHLMFLANNEFGRKVIFWEELAFGRPLLLRFLFLTLGKARAPRLAAYAGLVDACRALFEITANPFYQESSKRAVRWLKSHQLSSGAFPESVLSKAAYTRAGARIFEVLALDPMENKESIDRVLAWLSSMQYDEENTFFVPEEIRPKIIGGFRHDYFNQEVWIDAAGHYLLGGTRLIKAT